MGILFVNGSPNKEGNTVSLANALLEGKSFETLHLTDYKIYAYGQNFPDDAFASVIGKIKEADTVVIGSPLYWHSMSGAVRNLLDRSYGFIQQGAFGGKDLYFVFQGAAPTKEQLEAGSYTMGRYAALYGMNYKGMASSREEARKLGELL